MHRGSVGVVDNAGEDGSGSEGQLERLCGRVSLEGLARRPQAILAPEDDVYRGREPREQQGLVVLICSDGSGPGLIGLSETQFKGQIGESCRKHRLDVEWIEVFIDTVSGGDTSA